MSDLPEPNSNPLNPVRAPAPLLPASAPASDRYAVFKNRNFRLYLVGRFIASFGQQMLAVAIGWELYDRTHSSWALGMVGLVQILPLVLLTLPAGHYADNHERRGIMLGTQLLIAGGSLGLALVSHWHAPVVWTYLFLLALGVARTFLWPASGAFLPQIVPREHFTQAVTWNSSLFQISSALGPVVGGALIALTGGAAIVYALNILTALLCFLFVWPIQVAGTAPAKPEKMTLASLRAGFSFVVNTKIIFGTISLDLFAVLLGGATALLPVYASDILHVGAERLGWLQGALPVGSALMAVVTAHRPPFQHAGRTMLWAVAGFGVATIVFGLSRSFWLSLSMMFVCGALDNISVIVRQTLVQVLTPDTMRGRVSAVNGLFIGTSNQFGGFESGFVASLFGPIFAVVSGGVGTILVVVATALIWPEIRNYGRLDGSDQPGEGKPAPAGAQN